MTEPCAACGHFAGQPLPPGRILRRRRQELGFTIEKVLELAGSERAAAWLYEVEARRIHSLRNWQEFVDLCRALTIDPVAADSGRLEVAR